MPPHLQKKVTTPRDEDENEGTLSFAIRRIDLVKRVIDPLKAEKPNLRLAQFCRSLAGILFLVESEIRTRQQGHGSGIDKIAGILDELERLCSHGKAPSGKKTEVRRWPTLGELAADKQIYHARGCLRKFSNETRLQDRRRWLDGLRDRLSDQKDDRDQVDISASRSHTTSSLECREKPEEDIREGAEPLYNALQAYRSCNREGSLGNITTKIRIKGCVRTSSSPIEFGVLFLGHPHAHECRWKEARILVPTEKSVSRPPDSCDSGKVRRVHFVEEVRSQSSVQDPPKLIPATPEEFCRQVSMPNQARINLCIQGEQFVFQKKCESSREWLVGYEAVPLADLIRTDSRQINTKMKAVLAYLLAKAVWQFYDSGFLGRGLTKNEVYFLFERRGATSGIFVDEPMIMTQFREPTSVPSYDESDQDEGTHDMPKVLALGIMLLELETNTFIEKYRHDLEPGGQLDADTYYKIAKRLVDDQESCQILSDLPLTSPLGKILPLCIKAGELERRFEKESSARKKAPVCIPRLDGLRSTIYTEIVKPLEKSLEHYTLLEQMKALRKTVFGHEVGQPNWQATVTPVGQDSQQPSASQATKGAKLEESTQLRMLSREWFQDFDRLKDVLRPLSAERGPKRSPVKIAVLDTGITDDEYVFYLGQNMVGGYRDFVNRANDGSRQDVTGHGSIAASLLARVCPYGVLYFARVLEKELATKSEVQNVVDAIEWAVEEKADIITMALGFEKAEPAVEDAVRNARARGIHLFSAASNNRNTSEIYCPANMHDCVFGIFVTNAGNRESRDLNPSMSPGSRPHCFGIFGEHVEWQEFQPLVKGASYSTSIAAGLAALLLQFSRQEQDGNPPFDLTRLKHMAGLAAVFREMSRKDGSCDCIWPSSLLNREYEKTDITERAIMRKKQRDWIRNSIKQSLDNMYKSR